jgi:hypothetical protein
MRYLTRSTYRFRTVRSGNTEAADGSDGLISMPLFGQMNILASVLDRLAIQPATFTIRYG